VPESRLRERDLRISGLKKSVTSGGARVSARVTWEDSDKTPLELFFETDANGAADLAPEPEAFLAACFLPAMREGERRVAIEGAICGRLVEGLAEAVATLRRAHGAGHETPAIEPASGLRALSPRRPARAAMFYSGGVDTLEMLRRNRRAHVPGEPGSFVEALWTFGHLCPTDARTLEWNRAALEVVAPVVAREGLALTTMRTNIWQLAPDIPFLGEESLSSALAAVAHVLRARFDSISVASGRDAKRERLRGSCPMLDPLYGTSGLEIRHEPNPLTRFERIRAIAEEPGLLENLIVCLAFPTAPQINCGECEKCLRTMTALIALGKLGEARLFPARGVTPELLRAARLDADTTVYWDDHLPLLAENGRGDLLDAIAEGRERTRRVASWNADEGFKGSLRRLDRRYLGGRLLRLRRRLSARGAPSRPLADP
jgi:hypothetical protein